MSSGFAVVKVGGSLYDLPDLAGRLGAWLATLAAPRVMLVPGGGAAADVVRDLDRRHRLGEAVAHELALRAMTLNAWFLSSLLAPVAGLLPVDNPLVCPPSARLTLLDAHAFAAADAARHPGALPACWDATSDAVAARAAVVLGADELVLLKSADLPQPCDWAEAGRRGVVDPVFVRLVLAAPGLRVRVVNLRCFRG